MKCCQTEAGAQTLVEIKFWNTGFLGKMGAVGRIDEFKPRTIANKMVKEQKEKGHWVIQSIEYLTQKWPFT